MRVLCPTIPSGKTAHGPTRWVNCQSPERHEEWCLLAAGEERRRGEGRKDASRSSGTGVAHLLLPIRASSFWKRPKVTSLLLPERNRSVPTASFGKNRIGKPWLLISIELFIPKFGTAAFWHWLEQKLVGNPCLSPHSARGQKCREGEGGRGEEQKWWVLGWHDWLLILLLLLLLRPNDRASQFSKAGVAPFKTHTTNKVSRSFQERNFTF